MLITHRSLFSSSRSSSRLVPPRYTTELHRSSSLPSTAAARGGEVVPASFPTQGRNAVCDLLLKSSPLSLDYYLSVDYYYCHLQLSDLWDTLSLMCNNRDNMKNIKNISLNIWIQPYTLPVLWINYSVHSNLPLSVISDIWYHTPMIFWIDIPLTLISIFYVWYLSHFWLYIWLLHHYWYSFTISLLYCELVYLHSFSLPNL